MKLALFEINLIKIVFLLVIFFPLGCERSTSKDPIVKIPSKTAVTKKHGIDASNSIVKSPIGNILPSNKEIDTVRMVKFSYGKCLNNCDITSRIINENFKNKSYNLTFGAHLNCWGSFNSNVVVLNDTLNFIIKEKPLKNGVVGFSNCNCFFHISYTLLGIKKNPKVILINGQTFKVNQEENSTLIVND